MADKPKNKIALLLPFVDDEDPQWRADHESTGVKYEPERFRSWKTLRYVLRSYAENIPWADVKLIVARESQIPNWYDGDVTLHSEFIPECHLPTFNSDTIESFLWNIPGLGERVIYSNDDIFALMELKEEDFFDGDNPRVTFVESDGWNQNVYRKITRSTMDIASDGMGVERYDNSKLLASKGHNMQPIVRWQLEYFRDKCVDLLAGLVTPFRNEVNVNQWAYAHIARVEGQLSDNIRTNSYFMPSDKEIDALLAEISEPTCQLLCVNDHEDISSESYLCNREKLVDALASSFPNPCRYEKTANQETEQK